MKPFRHPSTALAWECWRLCRAEILGQLLLVALVGLTLRMLANLGGNDHLEQVAFAMAILVSGFGIYSFAVIKDRPAVGFSFSHSFIKPVSTRKLVLVPMAIIFLKSLLLTLLSLSVIRFVSGVGLPIFHFAFTVGVLATLAVAISWGLTSLMSRLIVGVALFLTLALLVLGVVAHQAGSAWIDVNFFSSTLLPMLYLLGIGILAVAFWFTVQQVDKQRHQSDSAGPRWGSAFPFELEGKAEPIWLTDQFSSPFLAMVRYERCKVGWMIYGKVALVNAVVIGLTLVGKTFNPYGYVATELSFSSALSMVMLTLLLAGLLGSLKVLDMKSGNGDRPLFEFALARPVTDSQLIFSKLLASQIILLTSMAITSLFIWLLWLLLRVDLLYVIGDYPEIQQAWNNYGWFGVGLVLLLAASCTSGVGALIFLILIFSLRHGLAVFLGSVLTLAILFLMGLDSEQNWQYRDFWVWLGSGLAGAVALLALIAAAMCLVKNHTERAAALIVLAIWWLTLIGLAIVGSWTMENGITDLPWETIALVFIGSWIVAGLTISIPSIFRRLRHQ